MEYLARDIMNSDVIAVATNMDLRDLAKLFLEKGITGAPVIDALGNLAGVISQTDLVYYTLTRDDELRSDSHFYDLARMEGRHIPGGFQIEDTNTGCVADVMTPIVHSVTERASIDSVARLMTDKHIHRVIVRRGQKVAGIISALDVLRIHGRSRDVPKSAKSAKGAKGAKSAKGTKPKRTKKSGASRTRAVVPARKRGLSAVAER